ncbi:hypothetical protein ColKHC_09923 [Colletotrichum higginsianum]|nr:hypothetical protein ColKHC_09923 [Colletotrichum higginsianum]
MASSSSDRTASTIELEPSKDAQQDTTPKTRSNEPPQKKTKMLFRKHRELLLANVDRAGHASLSSASMAPSSDQPRNCPSPKASIASPSCSGAIPFIPEIRVKNAEPGVTRVDTGGSVSPTPLPQSSDHLQVPGNPKPKVVPKLNAKAKRQQLPRGADFGNPREKKTFIGCVDRALGLHLVRTYGNGEALVGERYRTKRNVFRFISAVGILMAVSLCASIALFIYFASRGLAGPEWFAWIAVSAAGLIWSLAAFIMVRGSKRSALHDVEIARQSIIMNDRIQNGMAAPVAIISGPSSNRQQSMRAGSATAAAASIAASVGATPAFTRSRPDLGIIMEEGEYGEESWARGTEERLDTLVADNNV